MIQHYSKNLKTKKNNKLRNKYFKKTKGSRNIIPHHKIHKQTVSFQWKNKNLKKAKIFGNTLF